MAHIVYTWELGDNFGHMAAFAPFAKQLTQKGHTLSVIMQHIGDAHLFFDREKVQFFQAPFWKNTQKSKLSAPITYSDLLRRYGYQKPEGLANLIHGWQSLLTQLNPDIIISNAAPTAMLASRHMAAQQVTFGTGYCCPPATTPLPSIRPWQTIDENEIHNREQTILTTINQALDLLKQPKLEAIQHLFDTHNLITVFEELEHYNHVNRPPRTHGKDLFIGPCYSVDSGEHTPFPEVKNAQKIFAYIRQNSPHFTPILKKLQDTENISVIISAPNATQEFKQENERTHLTISDKPVLLREVCQHADFAICHAGQGTVNAFLVAGIPLILFPNHVEQTMIANNVVKNKLGIMPQIGGKNPPYALMIDDMIQKSKYKENAKLFKEKHKNFDQSQQVAQVITELESLLKH